MVETKCLNYSFVYIQSDALTYVTTYTSQPPHVNTVADLGGVLWVLQHPQLSPWKKNLNRPFFLSMYGRYLFVCSVSPV